MQDVYKDVEWRIGAGFKPRHSSDALLSWFCDNSPQSVYKHAKSRSRANTGYVGVKSAKSSCYAVVNGETLCRFFHHSVYFILKPQLYSSTLQSYQILLL